ncbi:MarR family winged helix-turn-helix transcriptional regulator [Macrococcoides caseolyticum]|uniref:MarR family winged helix-turn-helix transcriptional regulator n=1 Tax=Macrococcoides caseolyticum TaxID=69966 RepID=UPI001F1AC96B|nr:winged helix DNA-binding protein [Macrococcus caseolyticus]MCE4955693.1 MarR family transcriptional regulator [Macrococcus caseolyticus]
MNQKRIKRFGQLIYFLDSKIDELVSAELADVTLTREHIYMLEIISTEENMTQKKLIYKLNKEQTAVSRAIKKLVDYEYIEKEQSKFDLRSTVLIPTAKGKKVLKYAEEIKTKVVGNFMRELDVKEREELIKLLEKMYNSFTLRDPFRY